MSQALLSLSGRRQLSIVFIISVLMASIAFLSIPANADLNAPTTWGKGYKIYGSWWDCLGENACITNMSLLNITGRTGNLSDSATTKRGALHIKGRADSDASASISFEPANASGYGIITWNTNASGNPSVWDMILQVHRYVYNSPLDDPDTDIHDHMSLYSRLMGTSDGLKIYNIPYNDTLNNISIDVQVPVYVSNSENRSVVPSVVVRNPYTTLNASMNAGNLLIYGETLSGDNGADGIIKINTNTSSVNDNAYMLFNNNRARFGYNGTRSAVYIGSVSGTTKPIVFDTNGIERMRISDTGNITFPGSNLNLPTTRPSQPINGTVYFNGTALFVGNGATWRVFDSRAVGGDGT